jgi:hypothetical protein
MEIKIGPLPTLSFLNRDALRWSTMFAVLAYSLKKKRVKKEL